jgi:hypothetical protein
MVMLNMRNPNGMEKKICLEPLNLMPWGCMIVRINDDHLKAPASEQRPSIQTAKAAKALAVFLQDLQVPSV